MRLKVPIFTKEKFRIKKEIGSTEIQKTQCDLKLTTKAFENNMPIISVTI